MTQEDKDFLWSLMPLWVRTLPEDEDMFPTYYGTLTKEGDIEVHRRVVELLNQEKNG